MRAPPVLHTSLIPFAKGQVLFLRGLQERPRTRGRCTAPRGGRRRPMLNVEDPWGAVRGGSAEGGALNRETEEARKARFGGRGPDRTLQAHSRASNKRCNRGRGKGDPRTGSVLGEGRARRSGDAARPSMAGAPRLTAAQLQGRAQQRHQRGEHQTLVERQVPPGQLLAQGGRRRRLRGRSLSLLARGAPGGCGSKCRG